MIGASPVRDERDTEAAKDITDKGARLNIVASHHFNRGMRAFFFALGYLGWFIHPFIFMTATTFVALVLYRRILPLMPSKHSFNYVVKTLHLQDASFASCSGSLSDHQITIRIRLL